MALIGVSAMIVLAILLLDAVRFHTASVLTVDRVSGPQEALEIAMIALAAVGVLAAIVTGARDVRRHRELMARLPRLGTVEVDRRTVWVVPGDRPIAFCAGWLRPRIYVSSATLAQLDPDELRAVVAHEGHHADRRDPLRLLLARAAIRALPAGQELERRRAILVELAADAAAVRSLGDPRPLAGALLAFDELHPATGVAPEHVDQLVGGGSAGGPSLPSFVPVFLAVGAAALLVTALALIVLPTHPGLPSSSLPACAAVLVIVVGSGLALACSVPARSRLGRLAERSR